MGNTIRTLYWQDDAVVLMDQKALPREERYVTCTDEGQVVAAIRDLTVRGAPAIGVAAAMAAAKGCDTRSVPIPELQRRLKAMGAYLPNC